MLCFNLFLKTLAINGASSFNLYSFSTIEAKLTTSSKDILSSFCLSCSLLLYLDSNNNILEDLNQNKYFYDLNGRRINMRSGINSNIYKVINRNSSGRITNIYDNRKYNSKINFWKNDNY